MCCTPGVPPPPSLHLRWPCFLPLLSLVSHPVSPLPAALQQVRADLRPPLPSRAELRGRGQPPPLPGLCHHHGCGSGGPVCECVCVRACVCVCACVRVCVCVCGPATNHVARFLIACSPLLAVNNRLYCLCSFSAHCQTYSARQPMAGLPSLHPHSLTHLSPAPPIPPPTHPFRWASSPVASASSASPS